MKILKDLKNNILKLQNDSSCADRQYSSVIIDSLCCLVNRGPGSGLLNIKAWNLAQRINESDELAIDDADFEFLMKIVESNPAGYSSSIHGQVMLKLLELERSSV